MAAQSGILAWEIPMDKGAWQATAHGVAKSQTWLSNFHKHTPQLSGNYIINGLSILYCGFSERNRFEIAFHWFLESSILIGEGNGNPLQYSCMENPMDGGAWWAAVPGVAKSPMWLSNFTFTFHFHALEKEMAPHSSTLAWRIPGMEEPGRLPSMGLHRVGHDWSDLAVAAALEVPVGDYG